MAMSKGQRKKAIRELRALTNKRKEELATYLHSAAAHKGKAISRQKYGTLGPASKVRHIDRKAERSQP